MKTRSALCLLAAIPLLAPALSRAGDWPQWRGPNRDGVAHETGLLKEWPKDGPRLVWQLKDIGAGYSTPSVVGDTLYLLSNEGLDNEFVQALAVDDGKRRWTAPLGKVGNPDQKPSFPGARSTPTVEGEVIYALSSNGELASLEKTSGKVRWQKSVRADFGGKPGIWAYSESPLVDEDRLICTPGGSDATIVALNKRTGEVLWKCAVPGGDEAAYASAIVVEAGGVRQYVQMLQKGMVGVDAKSGKLLWRYDKTISKYNANIPTPVSHRDMIYSAGAGTGGGAVTLKAAADAINAEPAYFSPKLPTAVGGAVRVEALLFGTGGAGMLCADFGTGDVKWEERALGSASLCLADGRLYLHGENGEVALVEPAAEGYREKGRFTPPDQPKKSNQMEKAWAYPVVAHGRLYIRDGTSLWCYDVRAPR
jgi:outer membrane protein assembly factor BamB